MGLFGSGPAQLLAQIGVNPCRAFGCMRRDRIWWLPPLSYPTCEPPSLCPPPDPALYILCLFLHCTTDIKEFYPRIPPCRQLPGLLRLVQRPSIHLHWFPYWCLLLFWPPRSAVWHFCNSSLPGSAQETSAGLGLDQALKMVVVVVSRKLIGKGNIKPLHPPERPWQSIFQ